MVAHKIPPLRGGGTTELRLILTVIFTIEN